VVATDGHELGASVGYRRLDRLDGLPDGRGHLVERVKQIAGDDDPRRVETVEQPLDPVPQVGTLAERVRDAGGVCPAGVDVGDDECIPDRERAVGERESGHGWFVAAVYASRSRKCTRGAKVTATPRSRR